MAEGMMYSSIETILSLLCINEPSLIHHIVNCTGQEEKEIEEIGTEIEEMKGTTGTAGMTEDLMIVKMLFPQQQLVIIIILVITIK